MTDAEILVLVRQLEECRLKASDFHHRDHLAVSAAYLYNSDFETALATMRHTLKRFIAHHGLNGYHETITRFWMKLVEEHLDRSLCLAESVQKIQGELGDKNLIRKHYSEGVLNSIAAKEQWVEADLARSGR